MGLLNRIFKRNAVSHKEDQEGAVKRQKIIDDAEAMKRLVSNPDFIRFCEIMQDDREGLNKNLIDGENDNETRIRLIARINQIDRNLKKPQSIIWQMENLTEVRDAIKEQTRRAAGAR